MRFFPIVFAVAIGLVIFTLSTKRFLVNHARFRALQEALLFPLTWILIAVVGANWLGEFIALRDPQRLHAGLAFLGLGLAMVYYCFRFAFYIDGLQTRRQ